MTATVQSPENPQLAPAWRRRRWRIVVLATTGVLVLAATGFGIWFWRYAATYSPLSQSGFWGPCGHNARHLIDRTTDLGDELYIDGPGGTETQFITGLENSGSHGVTIESLVKNPFAVAIQWTPYVTRPGGDLSGERLPLRQLPAAIGSHQQIRLIVTLRKPACSPNYGYGNIDSLVLKWHALGVDHEYRMQFGFGLPATFVACPAHVPNSTVTPLTGALLPMCAPSALTAAHLACAWEPDDAGLTSQRHEDRRSHHCGPSRGLHRIRRRVQRRNS